MQLGDDLARLRTQGLASQCRGNLRIAAPRDGPSPRTGPSQGLASQWRGNLRIAAAPPGPVRGLGLVHISTTENPFTTQRRKSLVHIAMKVRIAPRSAGVIHAH